MLDSARLNGTSLKTARADENAELAYAQHANTSHRKLHGQFFTPPALAALMADWVVGAGASAILDPSMGTGILGAAILEKNGKASITAYESDPLILSHARKSVLSASRVIQSDYLSDHRNQRYDGVIMNPPYIRHREIEGQDHNRNRISVASSCVIPKSANLYIYFVLKALTELNSGGRGAFLIPSEWMSANFSKSFKSRLVDGGDLKEAILFSNCSNVFDDALTTASILLCERQ